jgi:hypothetical protein
MKEEFTYFPETKARPQSADSGNSGKAKDCKLTVSCIYVNEKTVPAIRLAGAWLKNSGFGPGQKVIVREQPGQLLIQLAEEGTPYES